MRIAIVNEFVKWWEIWTQSEEYAQSATLWNGKVQRQLKTLSCQRIDNHFHKLIDYFEND